VTFTATVADSSPGTGTPTGSVTFLDGTAVLGTATLSTAGGITTATFTTTYVSAGSHSITAAYGGDARSKNSTSLALGLTVT
jgi:hypothetical protein